MNVVTRTAAVLLAWVMPLLATAPVAFAADTVSTAAPASPARLGAIPAHWGPADCCGGGWYGGYGGACGGMYFHDGYWYDECGDVLTGDPNSWPHDN